MQKLADPGRKTASCPAGHRWRGSLAAGSQIVIAPGQAVSSHNPGRVSDAVGPGSGTETAGLVFDWGKARAAGCAGSLQRRLTDPLGVPIPDRFGSRIKK